MGVYDPTGDLVNSGDISGGKSYCPDIRKPCKTAMGTFTVYDKIGPKCKSKIFPVGKGGAPMPFSCLVKNPYKTTLASLILSAAAPLYLIYSIKTSKDPMASMALIGMVIFYAAGCALVFVLLSVSQCLISKCK